MAEMTVDTGCVVLCFDEDTKRDVLFASSVARHAANELDRLAVIAFAARHVAEDKGPSIEVRAVTCGGKPLVQWVPGRWVSELRISPVRAVALARVTRQMAAQAERACKWIEQRDPRALIH